MLQHVAALFLSLFLLQCVAACCSALQCVAVRCSVLQSVASLSRALSLFSIAVCCSMLQRFVIYCSVLQLLSLSVSLSLFCSLSAAVCCSVSKNAVSCSFRVSLSSSVAVCCTLLQSIVDSWSLSPIHTRCFCCRILQCVAVCCRSLVFMDVPQ